MNASSNASGPGLPHELQFRAPRPEDITWARPMLLGARRMGSEFCFGNLYAWAERQGTEIARAGGFFLIRSGLWKDDGRGSKIYGLPLGTGDLGGALALLREDARRRGVPLALFGVTSGDIPRLEEACPGAFRYETNRDFSDYIYRREDLARLPGKKYHQKRNHVARFTRENDWECEPITPAALDECLAMARQWVARNGVRDPGALLDELRAMERCFAHYEAFGLCGALLRTGGATTGGSTGGRIVAFTLGEELNEHCFCTHFEKAFTEEPGAYQMINRCFAAMRLEGYEFVNREEDLGDEGLRRAKLSYYPAILLEKYLAIEN